jgi:hypothetical protein
VQASKEIWFIPNAEVLWVYPKTQQLPLTAAGYLLLTAKFILEIV